MSFRVKGVFLGNPYFLGVKLLPSLFFWCQTTHPYFLGVKLLPALFFWCQTTHTLFSWCQTFTRPIFLVSTLKFSVSNFTRPIFLVSTLKFSVSNFTRPIFLVSTLKFSVSIKHCPPLSFWCPQKRSLCRNMSLPLNFWCQTF